MGATKKLNHKSLKLNRNIFLNPRYYRTFTFGSFAFLLAFLASAILTPVSPSSASSQTLQYDLDITGEFYVQVTGSENLSLESLQVSPLGQLAALRDTINVETNSPTGYKLLFSTDSSNLVNNANENAYFTPTPGTIESPTPLSANTWGFAFDNSNTSVVSNGFLDSTKYYPDTSPTTTWSVPDSSSTWAAVPTTATQIGSEDNANLPNGTDLDMYYGINATTTLPAGTYTTTITYTALSEGVNLLYMQNFTQSMCNAMEITTSEKDNRRTVIDARDNKEYKIAKLTDGNCWMVQNLALDPIDSTGTPRTLTTKDTNINLAEIASGTYTFPNDTLITSGTQSVNTKEQIYNADAAKTTTSCDTTTNPYCVTSDELYGNYYNWMSATLGVGTTSITSGKVYSSVCPKGWRLPDSGDSTNYGANAPDKSYGKLMYSVLGFTAKNASEATGGEYVRQVQQAPLYFPLNGHYNDTAPDIQGIVGTYWSRTAYSSSDAYGLHFNAYTGYFYPQGSGDSPKRYGFSVRCVFGDDTIKMQDFTTTMCNTLAETTASADDRLTLTDSRDGKQYKIAHLADNNCWMVSNLALDGTDINGEVRELTPADSDVTENRTLAPNSASGLSKTEVKIYSGKATSTTTSCNLTDYPYCVESDEPYGNFYNWFAATATTGTSTMASEDAPDSICPKGWKLPASGTDFAYGANAPDKSYGKLIYSVLGFNSVGGTGNGAYVQNMQKPPLYFPLAGEADGYGYNGQGSGSIYWSRVALSKDYAYRLGFSSSPNGDLRPQYYNDKASGYSVRCVLADS